MTCKDCIHNDVCRGVYLAIQDNTKLTLKEFQILCEKEDFDNQDIALYDCLFFQDRSRFVELPCKVGDLIYIIKKARGLSVRGAKVNSITITESGKIQVSCYRSSFTGFWGDDAFATKEEAEQALKERENDEK